MKKLISIVLIIIQFKIMAFAQANVYQERAQNFIEIENRQSIPNMLANNFSQDLKIKEDYMDKLTDRYNRVMDRYNKNLKIFETELSRLKNFPKDSENYMNEIYGGINTLKVVHSKIKESIFSIKKIEYEAVSSQNIMHDYCNRVVGLINTDSFKMEPNLYSYNLDTMENKKENFFSEMYESEAMQTTFFGASALAFISGVSVSVAMTGIASTSSMFGVFLAEGAGLTIGLSSTGVGAVIVLGALLVGTISSLFVYNDKAKKAEEEAKKRHEEEKRNLENAYNWYKNETLSNNIDNLKIFAKYICAEEGLDFGKDINLYNKIYSAESNEIKNNIIIKKQNIIIKIDKLISGIKRNNNKENLYSKDELTSQINFYGTLGGRTDFSYLEKFDDNINKNYLNFNSQIQFIKNLFNEAKERFIKYENDKIYNEIVDKIDSANKTIKAHDGFIENVLHNNFMTTIEIFKTFDGNCECLKIFIFDYLIKIDNYSSFILNSLSDEYNKNDRIFVSFIPNSVKKIKGNFAKNYKIYCKSELNYE